MKIEWNRKYTTIAAYAVIVVLISAVLVGTLFNLDIFKAALLRVFELLSPVVTGFCIAYLLNPLLGFYENKVLAKAGAKTPTKLRRGVGLLMVYFSALVVIAVFGWIVAPQVVYSISNIATQVPVYTENIKSLIDTVIVHVEGYNIDAGMLDRIYEFTDQFEPAVYSMLTGLMPRIVSFTVTFTSAIMNFIIGFIISIYVLYSKEVFFAQSKKLMYAILPQRSAVFLIDLAHISNQTFSRFITGKLLNSMLVGIECFIGLSLLNMPYPMLISVIIFVTDIIPYFGPIIGSIPSILLILMVDPLKAVWFLVFILALQQLDSNIVSPKIIGESIGLTPFWVIFSITLFGGLFGFWGMFIGVPLFSVVYTLIREFTQWRLEGRDMPTHTEDYASPEHPLLIGKPDARAKKPGLLQRILGKKPKA